MRDAMLAAGVALMSLIALLGQLDGGLQDRTPHVVLAAFGSAADRIPPSASVAYVSIAADPTGATAERFLAQYYLAPRIVTENWPAASFVLTGPGAPPVLDGDPRLRAFDLIHVTPAGARLYRRRP
ncbi:MAG TPA: hypothetical protein PLH72_09375 [Vicinamibacterales bacterium]|nr:hypothetical protein [Vicinamibacterales bacterium]